MVLLFFLALLLLVCAPVLAAGWWLVKSGGQKRGRTLGVTLIILSFSLALLLWLFVLYVLFSST